MKVVTALWALNTVYNVIKVTNGLISAANVILGKTFVVTAGQITLATGAVKLFRTALITTGIGALIVGLGFIIEAIINTGDASANGAPKVNRFTQSINESGNAAQTAAGKYRMAKTEAGNYIRVLAHVPKAGKTSVLDDYAYGLKTNAKKKKEIDPMAEFLKSFENGGSGATKAKAAGEKAGKSFVDGVSLAVKNNAKRAAEQLAKFVEQTPIKDEWKELGSSLGNNLITGLQKSFERLGRVYAGSIVKGYKEIYKKLANLQDAFVARTQFQTQLKENIMSMFDFKSIKTGLSGIIKQFKDQVEQTKKFRDNLIELQKLGLSGELFRKIAEGQDFNTAAELVKGGAGAVGEINALYGQLQGFSEEISTVSGNALYNLGVDAATGYVRTLESGFTSLQKEQELFARKAKIQNQQRTLGLILSGNLTNPTTMSREQIQAEYDKLAGEFQRDFGRGGRFTNQLSNVQSRTNLDQYFLGGGQMNGNIANQLAYLDLGRSAQITADRAAREQARAERYGRSINVNVSGGISTSAQIGQSVVEAIRAYERSSGQVYASA